ncbi:hypothetical protein SPRG_07162 [Saprolegnia parasitica CBS 223.65]|uniref:Anaphase-promoting complex subunit 4 WD40 domain-containing protein n=1 Tax=Saprolegnia parasitica (strain CBS 223.65) TaxID=695850 RepID=A0A067CFC7_SAPPC|nr:hypothetical protein SPRG_07162 [Saprolegnia parasitica CBS 223.65]KDO27890.1 hypothetical protein SPRG_07162 [Saprolegnia parasitica CBS 223.65]|eukprot:XP_012201347.1 hypothetical protein SPRG_07162 [Saprolegnia parasitica CBS 223.65]
MQMSYCLETPNAILMASGRSKLTLERVLGTTAHGNASMSVSSASGEIAYAAGCVVVMYNFRRDKQTRYYRVEKPVSALAFSGDGSLLAIAEKGHAPSITVWDVGTGQLRADLKRHTHGVAAVAMSTDGRLLVSAGLVHDKMLYAWDTATQTLLGAALLSTKIHGLDFSVGGRAFVSVGDGHVQFWRLDSNDRLDTSGQLLPDGLAELRPTPATMSRLADAAFVGVSCSEAKTFCVTRCGFLCCFGDTTMERLVSIEAGKGFAVSVTTEFVAVGGASSIVRLFDPSTLEYKMTLPFPAHCSTTPLGDHLLLPPTPTTFPAVVAVRVTGAHIAVLYADRALLLLEIPTRTVTRAFLFHSGPINGVVAIGAVTGLDARQRAQWAPPAPSATYPIPDGTFATVSDDHTLRLWHLEYTKKHKFPQPWCHAHSSDLLASVVVTEASVASETVPDVHTPRDSADATPDAGLQCLAVSEASKIAVGDKHGRIHRIDLQWPLKRPVVLPTPHASAVLSIAYGPHGHLASGGRDRLLHVYAPTGELLKTLENHSGGVHCVRFSDDGKRIVSGGADHAIVFTQVTDDRVFRYNSMAVAGGRLHDVVVLGNDHILSAVHARIDVHTLVSNKHVASYPLGEHHHIGVTPGPSLVALSGATDKTVYIVDYATGDVLTKAAGHGDAVTGVLFTLDGRRLISTSADGCIFVWRLSEDLQARYKAQLPLVTAPAMTVADAPPVMPSVFAMPPPAPPVPVRTTPPIALVAAPPARVEFSPETTVATDVTPKTTSPEIQIVTKSWQDGKQVVPGPLAPLPMEDWMKTRGPPLPPVELTPPKTADAPPLDRVPDWARTIKPLSSAPSPFVVEPRGKWGAAGVVDSIAAVESPSDSDASDDDDGDDDNGGIETETLYIKQSSGALQSVDVPIKRSSASDAGIAEILAVATAATTLDHARELHSKRKMQRETALAVAEMQSKLGQLGILKQRKPEYENDTFTAGYRAEVHGGGLGRVTTDVDSSTVVMQSLDVHSVDVKVVPLPSPPPPMVPRVSISLDMTSTDVSLSQFIAGHKLQAEPTPPPVETSQSMDATPVNVSLSRFLDGDAMAMTASVDLTPSNVSLSTFTTGYHAASPVIRRDATPATSVDTTPTNVSLSVFTAGYHQDIGPSVQPSVCDSMDVTSSLSRYVTGYDAVPTAVSASMDVCDVSLSTFVAGHAPRTASPRVSQSLDPTTSSFSAFTAGYNRRSVETSSSLNLGNISLSEFTSGYQPTDTVAASIEIPVNMSLSTFVAGHRPLSPKTCAAVTGDPAPSVRAAVTSSSSSSIDLTNVSLSHFVHGHDLGLDDAGASPRTPSHASVMSSSESIDLMNASLSHFVHGHHDLLEGPPTLRHGAEASTSKVFVSADGAPPFNDVLQDLHAQVGATVDLFADVVAVNTADTEAAEIAEMARLLQLKIAAYAARTT